MRKLMICTLFWLFAPQSQMVAPKVEHKKRTETQVYDEVTRSCPDGYEGHFVDIQAGFGGSSGYNGSNNNLVFYQTIFGPEAGYTVCFKKEFMDEIRKNPELLVQRPAPPRPI